MEGSLLEQTYPISFRKDDSDFLGKSIQHRHNLVLIGMRRIGINSFLRFFLSHKEIVKRYLNNQKNHLFIFVDLNNLVERELYPFWVLTLKRIVDSLDNTPVSSKTKKEVENIFLSSIQSKDLFLLIEAIRRSLTKLVDEKLLPTIFFVRFDRIKDVTTPEFFDNLIGLREGTYHKLNYIFTSYRHLYELSPSVFTKPSLSSFTQEYFMKPANIKDTEIIYSSLKNLYHLDLLPNIKSDFLKITDGSNQYLQLASIILNESKNEVKSSKDLFELLVNDERIYLQSEELWESLTFGEQNTLIKKFNNQKLSEDEKDLSKYLWECGFLNSKNKIFSPLFEYFLSKKIKHSNMANNNEFTQKEFMLFNFLKENLEELVERDQIIEAIWPEEEVLGVTDWAIDRLVSRVRNKLKLQKRNLEVVTIKTRGFKLCKLS